MPSGTEAEVTEPGVREGEADSGAYAREVGATMTAADGMPETFLIIKRMLSTISGKNNLRLATAAALSG